MLYNIINHELIYILSSIWYWSTLLQRGDKAGNLKTKNGAWSQLNFIRASQKFYYNKTYCLLYKISICHPFLILYLLHLAKHTTKNSRKYKPINNTESRSSSAWDLRWRVRGGGEVDLKRAQGNLPGWQKCSESSSGRTYTAACFCQSSSYRSLKWVQLIIRKL